MFQEKDSRDELGLGPIRDSIADHLFPGTSTIQTRLRYMFFVPWIYSEIEQLNAPPDRLMEQARAREIRLIEALRSGEDDSGVIGRDAGASLQRLPSSIYWAGLQSWGIRLFPGSQEAYFAAIPSLRRRRHHSGTAEDARAAEESDLITWRPGLPPAPDDFMESADFQLTSEEAGFIVDRLVDSHPDSLLTHLAKQGRYAKCDYIWEHPDSANFPERAGVLISHAEIFSSVMHGASLLYNLMLSELHDNQEWVNKYREALTDWSEGIGRSSIHEWSLEDFWVDIHHESHAIREPARRFIRQWLEIVSGQEDHVSDSQPARDLVHSREKRLKGAQSRFTNRTILDRWGGSSGADRLTFRWPDANSHIRDLVNAN